MDATRLLGGWAFARRDREFTGLERLATFIDVRTLESID
jgi:hypothetical protein